MQSQQSRRNNKDSQSKSTQQKQQPLLAFRVLGALPLVNSSFSLAKNYYFKTKDSSDLLKSGLDFAESSVIYASAPLVTKYEEIDHFASNKLNQLEKLYENRDKVVDDIAQKSLKTIKKVTYPVGFTLGLASQARDKAMDIASPMVEKAFDYADEVVDNLMPADEPEDAEYLKMTVLQRKNPLRRVRNRTTLLSLVNLPSNSIIYGAHLSLEAYHFSALLADRFFYNMDRLLKLRSNIQFLTKISSAPLALIYPSNRQRLYDFLRGDGLNYINWSIEETLAKGEKLSGYLKENGLPNNAELLETALSGVKQLQSFLARFNKQSSIEAREEERSAPAEEEEKKEESEKPKPAARRRVINNEERPASFMTGDASAAEELEQEKQAKSDAKEPVFDLPEILFEEKVDEEGFSRARPGNVGHNHKVIPSRIAHNIAPTTSTFTHTADAIINNNPYGALLKDKHIHEKQTAARVGKDSLVVMDGTGHVAVAVAHEEPAEILSTKDDEALFFTDADVEGWKSVDNDVHHRRHHHSRPHRKVEDKEESAKEIEEEEEQKEEQEEKPVNLNERMLVVKSDVGLVAIAESKPNWSSSQEMGEWEQPKKTFHHTTLQNEEKKAHDQVHVDAQGNANPYSLLQSQ